jgi:multidrug efflux pump subunit AcrA (membrane-fusion protein)
VPALNNYSESLVLPNVLNIRNISAIYADVASRLESGNSLVLEIPSDAEADLSFVQLVEAARVAAKVSGKVLRLSSPAAGTVLQVLRRGGFVDSFAGEDRLFWFHREVPQ